ncbi:MAG: hypothetical protein JWN34_440 [Bryobacterales bacterium]|nr:hypothetical protein [Bryobacterales bacterium]
MLCGAMLLPLSLPAAVPSGADVPAVADEEQTPPAAPSAPSAPAATGQAPAAQAPPADETPAPTRPQRPAPVPRGQKPAIPDYPDPRGLTIGAYYFGTVPGEGPDLRAGKQAPENAAIRGLGKERNGLGVFASIPVSRTTEIRFEGFKTKGNGNQTLPVDNFVFGTQFYKNDLLSNNYRILSGKVWVDDLFWPHKFPVAKLRVKAIYGLRYLAVKGSVDAPLQLASGATIPGAFATGNKQVVLPALGLAPEYALSRHVLLRIEGSGFGLPHGSALWDGEGTVSYRRGKLEFFGGGKVVGFKTSPKKDYYYSGQVYGGIFGLKYHW